MALPRRLKRPPIAEALVDFRIAPMRVGPESFQSVREAIAKDYPNVEERRAFSAEFKIETGAMVTKPPNDLGFHGLFFKSADDARMVQFRVDGFTLNVLKNYETADSVFDEAFRLWRMYISCARPEAVSRAALRYINKLSLPFQHGDDLTRFLTSPPALAEPAPQEYHSYLSSIVAFDKHTEAFVRITQNLQERTTEGLTPLTIDVDAFRVGIFRTGESDLRPLLDDLRSLKNRSFFALLTDAALESYL